MKKWLYTAIILVMLISLSVLVATTSAFAWNQSFHALVAKKCLELDYRYIASYNARMGSLFPDFFWYLRDVDLIDGLTAYNLHGKTEEPCVSDETTYFYDIASGLLGFWNYRLRYFTKGIRTHVYADIIAHNTCNGYLEGVDNKGCRKGWVYILQEDPDVDDEDKDGQALHLALEFAVDALLVKRYGLQLNDLLFCYKQANFVEEAVKRSFSELGLPLYFDVSLEFRKYLTLMRALEKVACLYAPYLIKGEVDEGALSMLESSELMEALPELSEEGLEIYLEVLMILLKYPAQIYKTIAPEGGGMHWEEAVNDAIDFCNNPICEE